jgi:hypothetical protein
MRLRMMAGESRYKALACFLIGLRIIRARRRRSEPALEPPIR